MPKHVFLFSGSSAVGKTSILRYLIPLLEKGGMRTAICKVDCLASNDETVYKNLHIPTVTGLSHDICPDHFLVSNLPELWDWCDSLGRDSLLDVYKRQVLQLLMKPPYLIPQTKQILIVREMMPQILQDQLQQASRKA